MAHHGHHALRRRRGEPVTRRTRGTEDADLRVRVQVIPLDGLPPTDRLAVVRMREFVFHPIEGSDGLGETLRDLGIDTGPRPPFVVEVRGTDANGGNDER